MGLRYILTCCYCCHLADPGRKRKIRPDPREDIVDQQFQSRVYTRDDTGRIHIHVQPEPGSRMVSLNGSPIPIGGGTPGEGSSSGAPVAPGEGLPGS